MHSAISLQIEFGLATAGASILRSAKMLPKPAYNYLFPLFDAKCPHCLQEATFSFTEQAAYLIKIFGSGIGRMEEYLIKCGNCEYKEFVNKYHYYKWRNLGNAFNELQSGNMTNDEFKRYMDDLDLPELKVLFQSSDTWTCSCGESNPPNFAACWKCHAPSPVEPIESLDRPVSTGEWQPWKS